MKNLVLTVILTVFSYCGFSQVQWNYASKKISEGVYELNFTATVASGWHIYSQTTPDGGPSATQFSFAKNPLVLMEGDVKEVGKLEQRYEKLFGVDVKQYSNKVVFVQKVKLKAKAKTAVKGSVNFMTCNDKECMPPDSQDFSIVLQ